jgi:hypothetical protein
MQVTGFVVDLAGKCVEGMQMNWASYLINELEKDWRKGRIRDTSSTSVGYLC